MRKLIVPGLFLGVCLLLAAFRAHAQEYSLTDIGTLGGSASKAYGVNSRGEVVGWSDVAGDAAQHAFIWSGGVMRDLGTLGGTNSRAQAVNSSGQVVGWSQIAGNTAWHGFLYSNGSMLDLGTLGGANSYAYGVNSNGQVVGYSDTSGNAAEHAFIYGNGSMLDLGTLGGANSEAFGINSSGEVVGASDVSASTTTHAFIYDNGSMQDIGSFSGGEIFGSNAINSTGQIGATGLIVPTPAHYYASAYLYTNGAWQQLISGLGNPSGADAINAVGDVVGSYGNTPGHAYLFSRGKAIDLNTVTTPAPAGFLRVATGINDSGWIVANGVDQASQMHAYLLVPLVPPTAIAGPNQTIDVGQTVVLNGTGSYAPNTSSASLEFAWSFVSVPNGSTATLSAADTAMASFAADEPGTYVVQLVVTDPATGLASSPSPVTISSTWTPPTANAGPAQSVAVGMPLTLSGSGTDPNGLTLSYSWSFASVPSGSAAVLANASTASASFVPDVPGAYVLALVVSDQFGKSAPATVTISAITASDYAQQQVGNAINYVASMLVSEFDAPGHRGAFTHLLQKAIAAIQTGRVSLARRKLEKAIIRTDGYPLRGKVDGPGPGMDWIIDATAQGIVYANLSTALSVLPNQCADSGEQDCESQMQ